MPTRKKATTRPRATDPAGNGERPPAPGRAGAPARQRELRARGQRTMRKLLDAGIHVFATRGYHAARVDDIVKAAQTSHGTFYLYFSNKEDLFQALVADVADELATLRGSLGPVTPDEKGLAELEAWLDRFASLYEHYGPIIRTWTEAEVGGSDVGRLGTDVVGELASALAEASGGPTDVDPAIATMALVAMIERLNYFVLSGQVAATRDQMVTTLAGVVHRALFPR